jgi:hypothetical protein
MARRASAHSVQQGCFLREWCSPFVRVMAKQRQCVVLAAVMHLAKPHWQAKSRAMLQQLLPESFRTKVMQQQPAKPPLLEPRD